ncbi:MAG: winged helix-turn-helix domain-containing protein [Deltaproteobacteria bacterium]|nr:winged helix-turn-helix domain-containing protein [Kofleriaceae bacterium]
MSTLAVVEEILRETAVPMSVREIVQRAGVRLPSKSKTPDTVVARDLSLDIKRKGDASRFARTSPGRYTLRDLVARTPEMTVTTGNGATPTQPLASTALKQERAAALPAKLGHAAKSGSAQVG